jgi:hypothetical protein
MDPKSMKNRAGAAEAFGKRFWGPHRPQGKKLGSFWDQFRHLFLTQILKIQAEKPFKKQGKDKMEFLSQGSPKTMPKCDRKSWIFLKGPRW